jgi:galacturonokinase
MGDVLLVETLGDEVVRRFAVPRDEVRVVRAPYRICPLGAHIDHQLGPVTAMAIDQSVWLAYAPSEGPAVELDSLDFAGRVSFQVDDVPDRQANEWGNYARGAVRALQQNHQVTRGIVGITAGRLHGGGVSSSAAVGVAFLLAFEEANGLDVAVDQNIRLDQAIENGYLGLRNGILDQAAILLSRRGYLTLIDCAALEHRLIAPERVRPFAILLAFSGLERALVGTDYNRRVDECAAAARTLLAAVGRGDEAALLGRVSADEYAANRHRLEGPAALRAEHFFSEVDRVQQGVAAWQAGDLETFGQLMTASGSSSIHNYQCGCPPLVDLRAILIETDGVYGARFSGAGFRGCCVALVEPGKAVAAAESVGRAYARRQPELAARASVVLCTSANAADIHPISRAVW